MLTALVAMWGAVLPAQLPGEPAVAGSTLGVGEVLDTALGSIQFHVRGIELSEPIVELGSGNQLELTFDALGDGVREFRYDLTHCDANWEQSQLSEIEYLRDYTEGDILDYDLAFNTVTSYTRFTLLLPNQYVAWTKSGNYVLNVYDQETDELVFRQRFLVVEPLITLQTRAVRPAAARKDRTNQEFDVAMSLGDVILENPRRTLSLTVVQNGDWRTALYSIPPRFERGEQLMWDYQDLISFPAMREWRSLELRTIESAGGKVEEIARDGKEFSVYLFPDLSRENANEETRIDLNGRFVIGDFDNRFDLQAEYVNAVFALKMPRDESLEPLYLYGALTNYALDEANRGVWNSLNNTYTFRTRIKQGFYSYAYVTARPGEPTPDWTRTEGNTFQAENEYRFLLYYRPYGERYDRLIGSQYLQTNRR